MIEAIGALFMLIVSIIRDDAMWGVAAGLFAIACNINGLCGTIKEK